MATKLFLGSVQIHSKLLSRGFFHIFCTHAENQFFERSCYFFKFSVRFIFQVKLIDLIFTLKVTVTFVWWKIFWSIYGKFLLFAEHLHLNVSNTFGMYLDAIWWSKKFKTILSYCKIHQNIRYFWRWSNPIFLKLNFSLLIVLLSIFLGRVFKYNRIVTFQSPFPIWFYILKKIQNDWSSHPPMPPMSGKTQDKKL